MITTKYDVGDKVLIATPGIEAQITAIVYTGFQTIYRCLYWAGIQAIYYEAYDYELGQAEEEEEVEA